MEVLIWEEQPMDLEHVGEIVVEVGIDLVAEQTQCRLKRLLE